MFAYVIGECGITPNGYWMLTDAETTAIILGHQKLQAENAANIRNLYTLTYNINAKKGQGKSAEKLWPLVIDKQEGKGLTKEKIEIYKKILSNSKN